MGRPGWFAVAVGAVAAVVLAVVGAGIADLLNGPGHRTVAEPVMWAVGGGLGLALGAVLAALRTGRSRWVLAAAAIGAVPLLVLVVAAFNDRTLDLNDQIVGSTTIVVVPAALVALTLGIVALPVSGTIRGRSGRRRRRLDTRDQTRSAVTRASASG